MSKSIKFKNNVYLDSSSVMYERTTLQAMLSHRFASRIGDTVLSDGQTKTWTLESWGAYLYINAHCYKRSVVLITVNTAVKQFHTDIIFKSENLAVPTFTFDYNTRILTGKVITGVQSRGNLFKLNVIL